MRGWPGELQSKAVGILLIEVGDMSREAPDTSFLVLASHVTGDSHTYNNKMSFLKIDHHLL